MTIYRFTFAVALAALAGCAVTTHQEGGDFEDVDVVESELAEGKPKCKCDMTGEPDCPATHPNRTWKRNTCGWSETRKKCHGKCESYCTNDNSAVASGTVFAGECVGVTVVPGGSQDTEGCQAIEQDN